MGQERQIVGDRFLGPDGRPEVVRWAFGLRQPADLPAYREAGLNLVYLDLPAADPAAAAQAEALAAAAAAEGFPLILALNPIGATEPGGRFDPADPEARRRTAAWLVDTVLAWSARPNLLAWALNEEIEEQFTWSPASFGPYLAERYGSDPARLAGFWGVPIDGFGGLTPELALGLDAGKPGGIGRAAMDVARWRGDLIAGLLRTWTRTIQTVDPRRAVIGGRMSRYRTLLVAPTELAALQPAMMARNGYEDPLHHQAGAVAYARRGGRFAVVPTLETQADPASLRRWVRLMLGQGAAGVSFASWSDLREDPARRAAVRAVMDESDRLAPGRFRPRAGAALILEPSCRGPRIAGKKVFGYGDFGGEEPASLLPLLHVGTRYGPLDVLTPADLAGRALDSYGCLILPATFSLGPLETRALVDYVTAGGVLMADLGLGSYDQLGDLARLPDEFNRLFGLQIADVRRLADVALVGRTRERVRMIPPGQIPFPELAPGLAQPGSLVFRTISSLFPELTPTQSTPAAMASALLDSPAAFFHITTTDTRVIATQTQLGGRAGTPPAVAGLVVRQVERGAAAWCSTFLWQIWGPGDPLYDAVVGGLLGHRPALTRIGEDTLVDPYTYVARGDHMLWLHRLANTPVTVQLDLPSPDGALYVGGLNVVRRAVRKDEHSPVETGPPLVSRRIVDLAAGELRVEETAPIALWPQQESLAADVVYYGADRLDLRVFGASEQATVDHTGRWVAIAPRPTGGVVLITDGGYRVTPGSRHRLDWWETATATVPGEGQVGGRRLRQEVVTADSDGVLTFRSAFLDDRLSLQPLAAP